MFHGIHAGKAASDFMRKIILLIVFVLLLAGCITNVQGKNTQTQEAKTIKNTNNVQEQVLENQEPNQEIDNEQIEIQEKEASQYIDFTREAYEQAKTDGKVIYLEFYANWCPLCANQHPKIVGAFDQLKDNEIIGFRVNFKDSETDKDEENLAREFGITYQHTRIILDRDRNEVEKATGEWSSEKIIEELKKCS